MLKLAFLPFKKIIDAIPTKMKIGIAVIVILIIIILLYKTKD